MLRVVQEVVVAAIKSLNALFVPLSFVVKKFMMLIYAQVNCAYSFLHAALSRTNKTFNETTSILTSSMPSFKRVSSSCFNTSNKCVVFCTFSLFFSYSLSAATLPPDSVDVLHHSYDGGGMKIDGPSVLVRKSIGLQFSLTGHYYVDSVSAASIDVLARASEYDEERTEQSIGMDFLHEKTIMSMGYTNSSENDYEADTYYFSMSQDFFGDLTTLSMGYARGMDEVGMRGQAKSEFEELERHNFKLGLTQILSKHSLMSFDLDVISDEGFIENPYRANRYVSTDIDAINGYKYQSEAYPDTRTSTAFAVRSLYYLPYHASLRGEYRFFRDTWGVTGHTVGTGYVHPIDHNWTVEGHLRYHTQDQADFYSDLYPYANSQEHLARDKELSTFSDYTLGAGVSYEFKKGVIAGIERFQFNLLVDYIDFSYDNFRDVTATGYSAGQEPLYEFDAIVTRVSIVVEY